MHRLIVGIPAKDEEERIGDCLSALCAQSVLPDVILLFLNDCADNTLNICRGFSHTLNLLIIEESLTGRRASAGEARRRTLTHATDHFADAIILTTDADSRPPFDWVEKNLRAINGGADVVCGQSELFVEDEVRIRSELRIDDMHETYLQRLLDEIDAIVNPNLDDPWPRHTHDSGASIGLNAGVLSQIGGAPFVSFAEDRALIDRCRMIDLKIRHDPEIIVPVSGRLEGRAIGGMAETIKRRTQQQDRWTDSQLEPAVDAYRRSVAKAHFRDCWRGVHVVTPARLAANLFIKEDLMLSLIESPFFGAAWDTLEAISPVLHRRRVAYADLAHETEQALQLRKQACQLFEKTHPSRIVRDYAA